MGIQFELPFLDEDVIASWRRAAEPLPSPWRRLYDALEQTYLDLQLEQPFGPTFTSAWTRLRARVCEEHGWTEDEFYDELIARRRRPALRVVGA